VVKVKRIIRTICKTHYFLNHAYFEINVIAFIFQ